MLSQDLTLVKNNCSGSNQERNRNHPNVDGEQRKTGIDIIGNVPWGTHFCQFYQTKQDLLDTLVPYIKNGLESNEFCMWVTADNLNEHEAEQALRAAIPDYDQYVNRGAIVILPYTEWYLDNEEFDRHRVLNSWIEKLNQALAMGFEGARVTGDTMWLTKSHWQDFKDYEESINTVISDQPLLVLCTYSLDKCRASEIIDVVVNHEFAMMKRCGDWTIIENSTTKQARQALQAALNELNIEIEQRKKVEQALIESEQRAKSKLDSIILPEGNIGSLELADILNIDAIQSLMDSFYDLVHIPMAIVDSKGKVLVGIGWQDVCTKFHRIHPETHKHCIESDTLLTAGVPPGEFKLYKCKNNMWDISTPIIVGDQHVGNLLSGQFFFDDEPLDYGLFRSQARKYGFIEDDYIAAVNNVPRLSRESLDKAMVFFIKLADMLSKLSYGNIQLARSLSERESLMDSLSLSEERLSRAQEIAHLGSWELDVINNHLSWSDEVYRIFGLQPQEFMATYEAFLDRVHPDDRAAVDAAYSGSLRDGLSSYEIDHRIIKKSTGEIRYVHEKCEHFRDENNKIIRSIGMVQDITERKFVETKLKRTNQRLNLLSETSNQLLISDDPQQAIQSLCEKVMEHLDCQVFFNYLSDKDQGCLHLNAYAGIPEDIGKSIEWLGDADVCRCVARDGSKTIVENISESTTPCAELAKRSSVQAYACHPLLGQGRKVIGTLSFGTKNRDSFTDDELALMRTITDQVATAMERIQLLESEKRRASEKENLYEREHRIANILQKALIPDTSYDITGCEVAVRYEAALKESEVGGDFYDIFDLGNNKVGILIGDVAGKGLAAAIQVAAARHSVRSYAYIDPRPEKVMMLVNNALSRDPQESITMLTAFFAVVDLELGVMTYANGGHETPILRRSDGTLEELAIDGRALGVLADYDYQDRGVILRPGDFVVMVTDGITEARIDNDDLFGIERMKSYLSMKHSCSADELADGLLNAAKTHAGGALRDDAAVIVFGLQQPA